MSLGQAAATGMERGCGYREEGGVYLECGGDPERGVPIEFFLADPPQPYEPEKKVGHTVVRRDGVLHVVDWIGEGGYEYPADFIEEARRYGVSRRINRQFLKRYGSELTHDSRILCVHKRAVTVNASEADIYEETYDLRRTTRQYCRKWRQHSSRNHLLNGGPCSRFLWMDPEPTEAAERVDFKEDVVEAEGISKQRVFADTSYYVARGRIDTHRIADPDLSMSPGLFASFPITRVAVVGDEHEYGGLRDDVKDQVPEFPVALSNQ